MNKKITNGIHRPVDPTFGISSIAVVVAIAVVIIMFQIYDLERLNHLHLASAFSVTHKVAKPAQDRVPLPEEVRGLYWTAYTASSRTRRNNLLEYMKGSGINSIVIDLKLDNGEIAYEPLDATLKPYTSESPIILDLPGLLEKLHEENIYRIARVAVMRDDTFATVHPEIALKNQSGNLWQDSIGSLWLDPAAPEVVDYAMRLGKEAWKLGFDEVQFDYVRFPSDGALNKIVYPVYKEEDDKVLVMKDFFEALGGGMKTQGIPTSYDLFGMTFVLTEDFGIGQRLLEAYPTTDFISPMVYPSHYANGFRGHANPALAPYDVVYASLEGGVEILEAAGVSGEESRPKFRPWLQDFDIGAVYTADLIEAQIQASRDAGASGWILWNARNVYEPANYWPKVSESEG